MTCDLVAADVARERMVEARPCYAAAHRRQDGGKCHHG